MVAADIRSAPAAWPALRSPRVSVVICNHDYARYLPEAIASALQQTLTCEVIVVDDGSTDGSRALLSQADPRVQVLLQPSAGQLAACNTGFARCTGDVVIFLDADDALLPQAAEKAAALFGAGVVKVHYRMALVDADGKPLGGAVPATLAQGDVRGPLQRHGVLYPSAPGSGNAYRRAVLQRLFPLPVDPLDRVAADFFLIYGSVAFGSVAACDEVLARYRLHRKPQAPDGGDKAAGDGEALVFGNAAIGNDEAAKVATRYARLRNWLAERGAAAYAPQFLDFSVQKTSYAQAVFARPYFSALVGSSAPLQRLLKSIWLQQGFSAKKKLGLSAWALTLLLAPRRTAFRLALYVCNPASRGGT